MRNIGSWKELAVGGIYNRVYTGSNESYGRINGKETFRVTETDPILTVEILHDQFGSAFTSDLLHSGIMYTHPEIAFAEFDLFECEDSGDWFVKAVRVTSLADAFREGLPIDDVRGREVRSDGLVSMSNGARFVGVYKRFPVEGRTPHPLLQAIYVVWNSWEEARADYERHGATLLLRG